MVYEIETRNVPAFYLAAVKFTATIPEIGQHIGPAFGAVMQYLERTGVQTLGGAVALYEPASGAQAFHVTAGFTIPSPIEGDGHVVHVEVSASEAAFTTHVGPYEELPRAYEAIQEWLKQNGREAADAPVWEEYHSGPETPPAEIRTDIYWPLEPR